MKEHFRKILDAKRERGPTLSGNGDYDLMKAKGDLKESFDDGCGDSDVDSPVKLPKKEEPAQ